MILPSDRELLHLLKIGQGELLPYPVALPTRMPGVTLPTYAPPDPEQMYALPIIFGRDEIAEYEGRQTQRSRLAEMAKGAF